MLTPQDIEGKRFTSVTLKKGYDQAEVDDFMDVVTAEFTALWQKLKVAEDRLDNAKTQSIVTVSGAEKLMAVAEEYVERCKADAKAEGESYVADAKVQAQRELEKAHAEATKIVEDGTAERHRQIGELEDQRAKLSARVDELTKTEAEVVTRLRSAIEGLNQ